MANRKMGVVIRKVGIASRKVGVKMGMANGKEGGDCNRGGASGKVGWC